MKRIFCFLLIILCMCFSSVAVCTAHTFQYTGSLITTDGLAHQDDYAWGLGYTLPQNQVVTSVVIGIDGLYNWDNLRNELYVNLLKDAPAGFHEVQTDDPNDNEFYNNLNDHTFTVSPYNGTTYVTDFGLPYGSGHNATKATNVSFTITDPTLLAFFTSAISNGTFGVGFDPDCHFWGSKIWVDINTETDPPESVPEPTTMLLLGLGLMGLAGARRKFKK